MNANERKSKHTDVVFQIVKVLAEAYELDVEKDLPISLGDVKMHELIDALALDLVASFGFCINEVNNGLSACIMGMASAAESAKCKIKSGDPEEGAQDDNALN